MPDPRLQVYNVNLRGSFLVTKYGNFEHDFWIPPNKCPFPLSAPHVPWRVLLRNCGCYMLICACNLTLSPIRDFHVFPASRYAIPHMEKNDYGRILLIASIAGKEGNAGTATSTLF